MNSYASSAKDSGSTSCQRSASSTCLISVTCIPSVISAPPDVQTLFRRVQVGAHGDGWQRKEASTKSGGLFELHGDRDEEDERIVRTAPDRRWPGWVLKLGQALDR